MNDDLIFSLDPSSTRTGWAFMKPPEQLVRAGLLLPDDPRASSEVRVGDMCSGLWQLLNLWLPRTILIEFTSGKVGRRHGTGGGAGLAIYGVAVGALWREVCAWIRYQLPEDQINTEVVLIRENQWCRGVNKKDRQIAIAALFSAYRIEQDPGGDIADAVGMAVWYLREQRMRSVV